MRSLLSLESWWSQDSVCHYWSGFLFAPVLWDSYRSPNPISLHSQMLWGLLLPISGPWAGEPGVGLRTFLLWGRTPVIQVFSFVVLPVLCVDWFLPCLYSSHISYDFLFVFGYEYLLVQKFWCFILNGYSAISWCWCFHEKRWAHILLLCHPVSALNQCFIL